MISKFQLKEVNLKQCAYLSMKSRGSWPSVAVCSSLILTFMYDTSKRDRNTRKTFTPLHFIEALPIASIPAKNE